MSAWMVGGDLNRIVTMPNLFVLNDTICIN